MKLGLLLTAITAAAITAGCSGAASSNGSAAAAGGADGSTASATAGTTSAGTGGSGGGGGEGGEGGGGDHGSGGASAGGFDAGPSPACMALADCGNFGAGCVNCAIESSCAAEYKKCFADADCKMYATCVGPCAPKDLGCLQVCATQTPSGAKEYGSLITCIFCGDCAAQCAHPANTCP